MDYKKDYYSILGITVDERKLKGEKFEKVLKSKYKKLAVKWHPDRNPGDKHAEDMFKEIAEAYDILLNKRDQYDQKDRFKSNSNGFGGGGGFGGFDDIFKDMNSHFSRSGTRDQVKGSSIRITLALTLEEMYNGVTKKVKYKRFMPCTHCKGSGMTENSKKKICRTCGGTGFAVSGGGGFFTLRQKCPTCGGKGQVIENPCRHCKGIGIVQKDQEISVSVPRGASEGMVLTHNGMGSYPPHASGVCGNFIVNIAQRKHDKYTLENSDLKFQLKVNVLDALLGCTVEVPTIDGKKLHAKIPQGTNDGHTLRFRGYGMPIYNTNDFGDMYGEIEIVMPKKLSLDERETLEGLRGTGNFKRNTTSGNNNQGH